MSKTNAKTPYCELATTSRTRGVLVLRYAPRNPYDEHDEVETNVKVSEASDE